MFRQQAERQQVMRLAAAHGLLQLEHPLRRFPFQPPEALLEQRLHTIRDVVLREEFLRLDAVADQVRQVKHRVTALGIKDAFARLAKLLK